MNDAWTLFEATTWEHVLLVLAVTLAARALASAARLLLRAVAERAQPRMRLRILRVIPVVRVAIVVAGVLVAVPILIDPTLRNVFTLTVAIGVALAFTFKDLASSLAAGLAVVFENTYQPGDWIELDGVYGEVRSIDPRSVRIVTADDTEVIIPHLRIWNRGVHNATGGKRSLLCVAEFYLHPDHDGDAVRKCLAKIAEASPRRLAGSAVNVIAQELPWGTRYKLKAYARESREQFLFISDLTLAGKAALRPLGVRFAVAAYANAVE